MSKEEVSELWNLEAFKEHLRIEINKADYKALERKTGVSKTTLHNFVSGGVIPSVVTLRKLAKPYNIKVVI